jgi:hypothetical protein
MLCLISPAVCHGAMWGGGSIVLSFLASTLYGGKWSPAPPCRLTSDTQLDSRLGGPHSLYGWSGEDENAALSGTDPGQSSPCPLAKPIELSRLLYISGHVLKRMQEPTL